MKHWLIALTLVAGLLAVVFIWANHNESPLPADAQADFVVVEKSERVLTIYARGKPLKSYQISLGRIPVGAKEREGDKKTPEGQYLIDFRKADSGYFRALHISYPSKTDTEAAQKEGASPGGSIMIHGLRNGFGWVGKLHRLADWTLGCVAVTNQEMAELWRAIPDRTPIEIRP